jgi:hypothetical protein
MNMNAQHQSRRTFALQKLTVAPKPGMKSASTEVGASLARGALDDLPPLSHAPIQVGVQPPRRPSASPAHVPKRASASTLAQELYTPSNGNNTPSTIDELLRVAESRHQRFMDNFDDRAGKLSLVQTFWERGNLIGCLQAVRRTGDVVIAADVLRMLGEGKRPNHFKVNMCSSMAPILFACLRCKSEPIVSTALSMLLLLLNGFAPQIMESLKMQGEPARELSSMDRRQRLLEAREAFCSLEGALHDVLKREYPANVLARATLALNMIHGIKGGKVP